MSGRLQGINSNRSYTVSMHIRLALLLLMVVSTTGTLRAQNEPSSSIRRAAIMLRNGDIEASRHLLDSLMTVYPKAIRGWNLLATAQRADGDAQASLRSYLRALDLQPGLPLSMLNVGIGYALTGSLDSSFAWLGRARATGKVDMNSVMAGPAASVLKEDSRYPGLFPTANDYADPFVEETTIIHQWVGENARDQFSWVARNVGDIDGDGIDDLSTSAPTNSSGAARAGKIYAYSGRTGQIPLVLRRYARRRTTRIQCRIGRRCKRRWDAGHHSRCPFRKYRPGSFGSGRTHLADAGGLGFNGWIRNVSQGYRGRKCRRQK